MNKKFVKLLPLLFCIILLISCHSRINKTNYDQIQSGMTYPEVVRILGDPSSSATLAFGNNVVSTVRWENRNGNIVLQLFNGRVKMKQFIEGVSTQRGD